MFTRLTALALALGISAAPNTAHAEMRTFGNKVTMGTVANIKLTPTQKRTFSWYRSNKSYFGAFYVVEGTDDTFYTRRFHSLHTAKESARRGCIVVHKSKACTLYAIVYPVGIDPNGKDVTGLSQAAAKDFERRYPKRQKKGKYGAFAVNRAYGWGHSFGWDSAKEAKAAALQFCKAGSERELAYLPIESRDWARRKGLHKCQVVDVRGPK